MENANSPPAKDGSWNDPPPALTTPTTTSSVNRFASGASIRTMKGYVVPSSPKAKIAISKGAPPKDSDVEAFHLEKQNSEEGEEKNKEEEGKKKTEENENENEEEKKMREEEGEEKLKEFSKKKGNPWCSSQ